MTRCSLLWEMKRNSLIQGMEHYLGLTAGVFISFSSYCFSDTQIQWVPKGTAPHLDSIGSAQQIAVKLGKHKPILTTGSRVFRKEARII